MNHDVAARATLQYGLAGAIGSRGDIQGDILDWVQWESTDERFLQIPVSSGLVNGMENRVTSGKERAGGKMNGGCPKFRQSPVLAAQVMLHNGCRCQVGWLPWL